MVAPAVWATLLTVSLHDTQEIASAQVAQPNKQAVHGVAVPKQGEHPLPVTSRKPDEHLYIIIFKINTHMW